MTYLLGQTSAGEVYVPEMLVILWVSISLWHWTVLMTSGVKLSAMQVRVGQDPHRSFHGGVTSDISEMSNDDISSFLTSMLLKKS